MNDEKCVRRATYARDIIRCITFGRSYRGNNVHPSKRLPYLPIRDAPFTCEPSRRDNGASPPASSQDLRRAARVAKKNKSFQKMMFPDSHKQKGCGPVRSRSTGTPHAVKVSRVSFQRSLESVKRRTVHICPRRGTVMLSLQVVIVSQVFSSATARATSLVAILSHARLASSSTADGSNTSS